MIQLLLYIVDACVVGTYLLHVLGRVERRAFDWANAAGGPLLLAGTLATVGWTPLLVLTIVFTIAGWIGVLRHE